MDDIRFDRLAATLAAAPSRRRLLGALLGTAIAGLLGRPESATAKKKKKKKNCPPGRDRCGAKCCQAVETCKKGKCVHHCRDGIKNRGETCKDGGGTCVKTPGVGGTRLNAGTCLEGGGCQVDNDCARGFCGDVGEGGTKICAPCRQDIDCVNRSGGPRCINNECHQCAADFDCRTCCTGRPFCIAPPGACPNNEPCKCGECRKGQEDTDCPDPGKPVCVDGVCQECGDDVDCRQGQTCNENGVCFTECDGNEDCPSGVACEDGACTGTCEPPGPCPACSNNPDVSCCNSLGGGVTCCDFGQVCNQQSKTCS